MPQTTSVEGGTYGTSKKTETMQQNPLKIRRTNFQFSSWVPSHVSFDSVDATMAMHAGIEKKMKWKMKNKNKVVNPNSLPGKISKHNCPVLSG
jgi:hypothetical protein